MGAKRRSFIQDFCGTYFWEGLPSAKVVYGKINYELKYYNMGLTSLSAISFVYINTYLFEGLPPIWTFLL